MTYYVGEAIGDYRDAMNHSGIMGMKWGQRRYRNYDGTLTEAGKARYGYGSGSGKSGTSDASEKKSALKTMSEKVVKVYGLAKDAQRKRQLENPNLNHIPNKEKDAEGYEAAKKKALSQGTAADVMKFMGDLTNRELEDAYKRLNYENLISELNKKNQPVPTYVKMEESMKKASNFIGTGVDLGKKFVEVGKMVKDYKESKAAKNQPKSRSQAYAEKALQDIDNDFLKRFEKDGNATINFDAVKAAYTNVTNLANLEKAAKGQTGKGK